MSDPLDIAHLLRRTEYVARPARITELSALTIAAAVDNILDFTPNGVAVTPDYLTWMDTTDWWGQYEYMQYWWLNLMIASPRPFREKMTLFWHGHFVSELGSVERKDLMVRQNQLYRTRALGNFRTLTHEMALQPAMLRYLSNADNVKSVPNQNFARELMELFTLGVGNYSEADVEASARAWTGHNAVWPDYEYAFRATQHDTGAKTFFGTTKNWDGPDIIDEILRDNAAKQLIAAKFVVKKLWEFLAYPKPEQTIVDELAAVLVANDMELLPTVRALLNRPEFYSTTAKQGLLKSPIEWAVSMCVVTGLPPDDSGLGLAWGAPTMGQALFEPPNVAGWKNNTYWINTSALSGRANLARRMTWLLRANGGFDDTHAMTPDAAVDRVATYFQIAPLSTSTRTALVNGVIAERGVPYNQWWATTNLLTAVMMSPELHLA